MYSLCSAGRSLHNTHPGPLTRLRPKHHSGAPMRPTTTHAPGTVLKFRAITRRTFKFGKHGQVGWGIVGVCEGSITRARAGGGAPGSPRTGGVCVKAVESSCIDFDQVRRRRKISNRVRVCVVLGGLANKIGGCAGPAQPAVHTEGAHPPVHAHRGGAPSQPGKGRRSGPAQAHPAQQRDPKRMWGTGVDALCS
jgi:hypothetical protein